MLGSSHHAHADEPPSSTGAPPASAHELPERNLGGHTFFTPTFFPSSFVGTRFAFSQGVLQAEIPDYPISQNRTLDVDMIGISERAEFSARCRERGVTFVGPSPEAIAAMGSKVAARARMIAAGVPVVPGSDGPLPDVAVARAEASRVGYPVILKASAGGGGKGMRVVRAEGELEEAWRRARAEAGASFGDDAVFRAGAWVRGRPRQPGGQRIEHNGDPGGDRWIHCPDHRVGREVHVLGIAAPEMRDLADGS